MNDFRRVEWAVDDDAWEHLQLVNKLSELLSQTSRTRRSDKQAQIRLA